MNAFFDEQGKLLYNNSRMPNSITSWESQTKLLYIINKDNFKSIIIRRIQNWQSAGKIGNDPVNYYINKYGPYEDISSLLIKDSKLITCGGREQINDVIKNIERLYSLYSANPSKVKIPNEVAFYMLLSPEIAKLEYLREDRFADEATTTSSTLNGVFRVHKKPRILEGKILIGTIHSHPIEMKYWTSKGNYSTFKDQFRKDTELGKESDGVNAKKWKLPVYSIGVTEVDFYSPTGEISNSKNGLCSNSNFISGNFNLLTHAFVEHAKTYF